MQEIPIIPGRGLNAYSAIKQRHQYLAARGFELEQLRNYVLDPSSIQTNIESFIGSVEIPVGVVGPLRFNAADRPPELVYCAAGTLEGALVASMNRGAKAISRSGGFTAKVIHQKMVRAPLFIFERMEEAFLFRDWVNGQFVRIKSQAEQHSNHADLQQIDAVIVGKTVHLKFVYRTGDAAGQNMTTTCTWHAMLWIAEHFQAETGHSIVHYVVEGNGSSDKKVSQYNIQQGRGIQVMAECILEERLIQKILRTSSAAILQCFHPSMALSKIDGMVGYNINVANAIAAIFVATGQDLASIHESAVGILNVEAHPQGLYLSLTLPSLVIGTVGGGTHLPKQQEALRLMGCQGTGKVERFAQLIAGFALSLEISTYAAIVSGEFAKAHEKLGRNKPLDWLTKSEIDLKLLRRMLVGPWKNRTLTGMRQLSDERVDNGVITTLTNRVSKKLIGFIPVEISFRDSAEASEQRQQVLLKSKALDIEVVKGLHLMAASIDPVLSDLLNRYKNQLEYHRCHEKEIRLYQTLTEAGFRCIPQFYGKVIQERRQIYLFAQELLQPDEIAHINSQKEPEIWTKTQIKTVLDSLAEIHCYFADQEQQASLTEVQVFEPWKAQPLYEKLCAIMYAEEDRPAVQQKIGRLFGYLEGLEAERSRLQLPLTLVHNDCNSRNIAMRTDGQACIYDWELAVLDLPQRDVVEFLSFVLVADFAPGHCLDYLRYSYEQYLEIKGNYRWEDWQAGYVYALKVYLLTRVSFYEVAGILDRYAFSDRILQNAFRMLELLEDQV